MRGLERSCAREGFENGEDLSLTLILKKALNLAGLNVL